MLLEDDGNTYYCFIKRLSALLQDQTKDKHKKFFCEMCLMGLTSANVLARHAVHYNVVNGRPTKIEMPEKGKNTLRFQNHKNKMKAPFVIYADSEAIIEKIPEEAHERKACTEKAEKHVSCGFAFTAVRSDGEVFCFRKMRERGAAKEFLKQLLEVEEDIQKSLEEVVPIQMTTQDWQSFRCAEMCHVCDENLVKPEFLDSAPVFDVNTGKYCGQSHMRCRRQRFLGPWNPLQKKDEVDKWIEKSQENCLFCGQPLLGQNFRDVVKDHCHITGKLLGTAHSDCNKKLRINRKTIPIPVVFQNLKGYDAHHLMQGISKLGEGGDVEIGCIPNNMEKYISFSLGGLTFIDSFAFLLEGLESFVKATPKEAFKITETLAEYELLMKKGIYPYEYMDSWERFAETDLPPKEAFFSKLADQGISNADYEHVQNVWERLERNTMGDYHDIYLQTDVALLAGVFENFREVCLKQYRLDPARYYTSPGLSWDALLKMTGVQHAPVCREGNAGRDLDGKQEVCKSQQSTSPGVRPSSADQVDRVPGRERYLRLGNEQAAASQGVQVDARKPIPGGDHV